MQSSTKHLILLNIATACIASSGFLGKLTTNLLTVETTLFWRCFWATLLLFSIVKFSGHSLSIKSKKHAIQLLITGALFYGHLYFYFEAIRVSSVAIAVLSMFTFPVMTALIEPFWFKKKLSIVTLLSTFIIIGGLLFIVPSFSWSNSVFGIILGLLSALCYTFRNLQSSSFVAHYSSNTLMTYQIGICTVLFFLTSTKQGDTFNLTFETSSLLFLLGLVPTAIGHNLFMNSFKHFSTSTASIITSLQPLLAILYAYLFINEIPETKVYLGGGMILLAILLETQKKRFLVQSKKTVL